MRAFDQDRAHGGGGVGGKKRVYAAAAFSSSFKVLSQQACAWSQVKFFIGKRLQAAPSRAGAYEEWTREQVGFEMSFKSAL